MAKVKWKMSLALILSGMLGAPAVASAHASGRITEVIRFVPHTPGRGMLRGYCTVNWFSFFYGLATVHALFVIRK